LLVGGRPVVDRDVLVSVDEDVLAARSAAASRALLSRAGVTS
jgi:hypothetical protein